VLPSCYVVPVKACLLLAVGLVAATVWLAGCQSTPFPEDAARSQYDRYDELRGRGRQAKETDVYGRSEPALNERLRPLEPGY